MNVFKNKYIMPNTDIDHLKELGFKYLPLRSSDNERIYIYVFPVYKYRRKTLIECNLFVNTTTQEINISVYNYNGTIYAPFYNEQNYNNNTVLETVNKKIQSEFRKLKIIKQPKCKKKEEK